MKKRLEDLIVSKHASLAEALNTMSRNRFGMCLVCSEQGRLMGVLTSGDACRAFLAGVRKDAPVSTVANLNPVTVTNIDDAKKTAASGQFAGVPILDAAGVPTALFIVPDQLVVREGSSSANEPIPHNSDLRITAIIPARGGSRRVPRKNIREVAGKPLIAWAIEAGLASRWIDDVVVSTDDEEIARIARQYGAQVPFMRPSHLAASESATLDVLEHAIQTLNKASSPEISICVLLEPTCALRSPAVVDQVIEALLDSGADSSASVCQMPHVFHPAEILSIQHGGLQGYNRETIAPSSRGHQQVPMYVFSAVAYATRASVITDQSSLFGKKCTPVITPWNDYIDIDTEEDLVRADWLLRQRLKIEQGQFSAVI